MPSAGVHTSVAKAFPGTLLYLYAREESSPLESASSLLAGFTYC